MKQQIELYKLYILRAFAFFGVYSAGFPYINPGISHTHNMVLSLIVTVFTMGATFIADYTSRRKRTKEDAAKGEGGDKK